MWHLNTKIQQPYRQEVKKVTKPSLSIVVPVYNTEKYLKRCMDSIMNQTLKDIEIIIVDDGSKEECAVLCDEIS